MVLLPFVLMSTALLLLIAQCQICFLTLQGSKAFIGGLCFLFVYYKTEDAQPRSRMYLYSGILCHSVSIGSQLRLLLHFWCARRDARASDSYSRTCFAFCLRTYVDWARCYTYTRPRRTGEDAEALCLTDFAGYT